MGGGVILTFTLIERLIVSILKMQFIADYL
jgi:hypothetical protein